MPNLVPIKEVSEKIRYHLHIRGVGESKLALEQTTFQQVGINKLQNNWYCVWKEHHPIKCVATSAEQVSQGNHHLQADTKVINVPIYDYLGVLYYEG